MGELVEKADVALSFYHPNNCLYQSSATFGEKMCNLVLLGYLNKAVEAARLAGELVEKANVSQSF